MKASELKNYVEGLDQAGLDEVQKCLLAREEVLKKDQAKEIQKKLFIGCFVTYQKGKTPEVGLVDVITIDHINIIRMGQNAGKKRRIEYSEIKDVSDQAPEIKE